MDPLLTVALVFVAISVLFTVTALRDDLREAGRLTSSRKTWLRIATLFAAIAITLALIRLIAP